MILNSTVYDVVLMKFIQLVLKLSGVQLGRVAIFPRPTSIHILIPTSIHILIFNLFFIVLKMYDFVACCCY